MPLARAGEIELSYERSGSGPPLLMIMGMSGTYSHWAEPFLSRLRERFDVIVYDHRGVGASTRMRAPFTISDLAGDAAGLLAALGVERAHIMGVSMGGMVAQELALSEPELCETLVLGCTYCGGMSSSPTRQATLRRLAEAMASGERDRAVRTAWEINVSAAFAVNASAYARFVAIGKDCRVARSVIAAQLQAIARHDTSERLAALRMPTFVVHGSADEMVPVDNGVFIAELIPGARLELFDDTGHLFFWEQPERSAELVIEHALAPRGRAAEAAIG